MTQGLLRSTIQCIILEYKFSKLTFSEMKAIYPMQCMYMLSLQFAQVCSMEWGTIEVCPYITSKTDIDE